MAGFGGEVRAYGEADEIVGIGQRIGFVEVVDAPNQAALEVAPGTEVFYVQVADGEGVRRFG
jgi:hypothetical protein